VDAGKHHLFISIPGKFLYLPYHAVMAAASDPSPRIRDDAVRAELVAAILHLDICPCMFRRPAQMQFLILVNMVDVYQFLLYAFLHCLMFP